MAGGAAGRSCSQLGFGLGFCLCLGAGGFSLGGFPLCCLTFGCFALSLLAGLCFSLLTQAGLFRGLHCSLGFGAFAGRLLGCLGALTGCTFCGFCLFTLAGLFGSLCSRLRLGLSFRVAAGFFSGCLCLGLFAGRLLSCLGAFTGCALCGFRLFTLAGLLGSLRSRLCLGLRFCIATGFFFSSSLSLGLLTRSALCCGLLGG